MQTLIDHAFDQNIPLFLMRVRRKTYRTSLITALKRICAISDFDRKDSTGEKLTAGDTTVGLMCWQKLRSQPDGITYWYEVRMFLLSALDVRKWG